MTNNFSNDDSCVAVWNFDSDGFTSDSKGSNDLTNHGADVETTTVMQGDQSAKFVATNSDYMEIADGDQDSGFPWRYADGGSVIKDFSICGRINMPSLPPLTAGYIISKKDDPNSQRVFGVAISQFGLFQFMIGSADGTSDQTASTVGALGTDKDYYFGVTFNSSNLSYRIRIWDKDADDFFESDITGNFTELPSVENISVLIGARLDNGSQAGFFDGFEDELVVFNRVLSPDEIDLVREEYFPEKTFCWGQATNVEEGHSEVFADWTGTGTVVGTGDAEALCLTSGQSKTSPVVNTGVGSFKITYDKYNTGSGGP